MGVASGAIIDGFIVKLHPWRYIYYVAIALIGAITLIVYATFPETAYIRAPSMADSITTLSPSGQRIRRSIMGKGEKASSEVQEEVVTQEMDKDRGWLQGLKLYHGRYTDESLWQMTIRPVGLLILPPVLWATLVMSVTIGFITAITSNVATAFADTYGFAAWQSGLCFVSAIIGCAFGIMLGGYLSDWVADVFTRRNNGIREPEMRLPAMMISVITGPLALALYGCGIKWKMHWIVPTIGIGLSEFILYPFSYMRRLHSGSRSNIFQLILLSPRLPTFHWSTQLTVTVPSLERSLSPSWPSSLPLVSCLDSTPTPGLIFMATMWLMGRWLRSVEVFLCSGSHCSSGENLFVKRL